jgi:4a-hydroxytetrahydrobiopterin dehydratase
MTERLDHDAIRGALGDLPGWTYEDDALRKEFRLGGFKAAIGFINRVADLATQARHHPDIENRYDVVTLTLQTHDAGGVTRKDLELARAIEQAATP